MEYFQSDSIRPGFCTNGYRSWFGYTNTSVINCVSCVSFKLSLWSALLSSTPGCSEPTKSDRIQWQQSYPALLSISWSPGSPPGFRVPLSRGSHLYLTLICLCLLSEYLLADLRSHCVHWYMIPLFVAHSFVLSNCCFMTTLFTLIFDTILRLTSL